MNCVWLSLGWSGAYCGCDHHPLCVRWAQSALAVKFYQHLLLQLRLYVETGCSKYKMHFHSGPQQAPWCFGSYLCSPERQPKVWLASGSKSPALEIWCRDRWHRHYAQTLHSVPMPCQILNKLAKQINATHPKLAEQINATRPLHKGVFEGHACYSEMHSTEQGASNKSVWREEKQCIVVSS